MEKQEMNTAPDILAACARGEITISQCWELLGSLRASRKRNEIVFTAPPSKVYEPLNEYEMDAIKSLQSVHFGAASSMRRFARNVERQTELTPRQREYLRGLVWRYRRQIFRGDHDRQANGFIERMKKGNE